MPDQATLTKRQLLTSGLICLVLAVVVVALFILPAEYNEGLTALRGSTGLDSPGNTGSTPSEVKSAKQITAEGGCLEFSMIDPETAEIVVDEWGTASPVLNGDNHCEQSQAFKTETIVIELSLDGRVEYKAVMNRGDAIIYSWTADQDIYTDMHAHQPDDMEGANPDFFTRYLESESREQHGSIIAPYDGHHGWFWLNLGDGPTIIELTVSGYYQELIEIELEAY